MARNTPRQTSRRARTEETSGGFRPSLNVHASVYGSRGRSEAETTADLLTQVLGIGSNFLVQQTQKRAQEQFAQGETDARAGQIDEEKRKKFKAYDMAAEQVGIEADLVKDAAEVRQGAQDFIANTDPEGLDKYLDEQFQRWSGHSENQNKIILPAWAALREELHGTLQAEAATQVQEKNYSDLRTIGLDLQRVAKDGNSLFDHGALHTRARALFGKDTNEALTRLYSDIMIETSDPFLLDSIPDTWADGTPTIKHTPGYADKLQDAQVKAANKLADAAKPAREMHELEVRDYLNGKIQRNDRLDPKELRGFVQSGVFSAEVASEFLRKDRQAVIDAQEKVKAEAERLAKEEMERQRQINTFDLLMGLDNAHERGFEDLDTELRASVENKFLTPEQATSLRRKYAEQDETRATGIQLTQLKNGFVDGSWVVFKGKLSDEKVRDAFDQYVEQNVAAINANPALSDEQKTTAVFQLQTEASLRNGLAHRPTQQFLAAPDFSNADRFSAQAETFRKFWTVNPRLARMHVTDDTTFDTYVTAETLRTLGRDPQQVFASVAQVDFKERSNRWMEGTVRKEALTRLKGMEFPRIGAFLDDDMDDIKNPEIVSAEMRQVADSLGRTGMFQTAEEVVKATEAAMKGRYVSLGGMVIRASADLPHDIDQAWSWWNKSRLTKALDEVGLLPSQVEIRQDETSLRDGSTMGVYFKNTYEPVLPDLRVSLSSVYDDWRTHGDDELIDEANRQRIRAAEIQQQLNRPEMIEALKRGR